MIDWLYGCVCFFVGHHWTLWSEPGKVYRVSFRWCRRCNASETK